MPRAQPAGARGESGDIITQILGILAYCLITVGTFVKDHPIIAAIVARQVFGFHWTQALPVLFRFITGIGGRSLWMPGKLNTAIALAALGASIYKYTNADGADENADWSDPNAYVKIARGMMNGQIDDIAKTVGDIAAKAGFKLEDAVKSKDLQNDVEGIIKKGGVVVQEALKKWMGG